MKKWIVSSLLAMAVLSGITSCSLQDEQIKVIAQNAGLFSAVGWIAMDNPEPEVVNGVEAVLYIIVEKAAEVQVGKTYTEVIYPEMITLIDSELIDPQYKPLCKSGGLFVLGSIDILFATHPEWKEEQELTVEVVNSFVLGAQGGLSLAADDPVMVAAQELAARRVRLLTE